MIYYDMKIFRITAFWDVAEWSLVENNKWVFSENFLNVREEQSKLQTEIICFIFQR
jgi:hypothetical protein